MKAIIIFFIILSDYFRHFWNGNLFDVSKARRVGLADFYFSVTTQCQIFR